jgi:hypothetical protein
MLTIHFFGRGSRLSDSLGEEELFAALMQIHGVDTYLKMSGDWRLTSSPAQSVGEALRGIDKRANGESLRAIATFRPSSSSP